MGMKDSILFVINGLLMAIVFFFVRILPIPYLLYIIFENWDIISSELDVVVFISTLSCPLIIIFLNIFWFRKIVNGILSVLSKKEKKSK
jgi:hypothetical protein